MAIADAPVRRIVTVDGADGRSRAQSDAAVDDVLRDPARPGYASSRVWATDRTPAAPLTAEQVAQLPQAIAPPPGGSLFRIVTVPPDRLWQAHATADAARFFFAAAGSPEAWCGEGAADPYMQHSRTLDLCVVLEGELTLVLDTAEVALGAGDTVVQRATRHAWRNRSAHSAVIAISSHDAEDPQAP